MTPEASKPVTLSTQLARVGVGDGCTVSTTTRVLVGVGSGGVVEVGVIAGSGVDEGVGKAAGGGCWIAAIVASGTVSEAGFCLMKKIKTQTTLAKTTTVIKDKMAIIIFCD